MEGGKGGKASEASEASLARQENDDLVRLPLWACSINPEYQNRVLIMKLPPNCIWRGGRG